MDAGQPFHSCLDPLSRLAFPFGKLDKDRRSITVKQLRQTRRSYRVDSSRYGKTAVAGGGSTAGPMAVADRKWKLGVAYTAAGAGSSAGADGTSEVMLLAGEERQRWSLSPTGSDNRKWPPEVNGTAAVAGASTDGTAEMVVQIGDARYRTSLSLTGSSLAANAGADAVADGTAEAVLLAGEEQQR